jgi:hypothetical protein
MILFCTFFFYFDTRYLRKIRSSGRGMKRFSLACTDQADDIVIPTSTSAPFHTRFLALNGKRVPIGPDNSMSCFPRMDSSIFRSNGNVG